MVGLSVVRTLWKGIIHYIVFVFDMCIVALYECLEILFRCRGRHLAGEVVLVPHVPYGVYVAHALLVESHKIVVRDGLIDIVVIVDGRGCVCRLVEYVAAEGEVGAVVSEQSEQCGHDVYL